MSPQDLSITVWGPFLTKLYHFFVSVAFRSSLSRVPTEILGYSLRLYLTGRPWIPINFSLYYELSKSCFSLPFCLTFYPLIPYSLRIYQKSWGNIGRMLGQVLGLPFPRFWPFQSVIFISLSSRDWRKWCFFLPLNSSSLSGLFAQILLLLPCARIDKYIEENGFRMLAYFTSVPSSLGLWPFKAWSV